MKTSKLLTFLVITVTSPLLRANLPLCETYPKLQKIPHIALGKYPSPLLDKTKEFGNQLNVKTLYIKDDGDSTKMGIPTGNKLRKLEFLLADARNKGFTTVCTLGGAGSNHALETAVCAKLVGMKVVLILDDQCQTSAVQRNIRLMALFSDAIMYADPNICTNNEEFEKYGKRMCDQNGWYFIPIGGSCAIGSVGYVNAVFELKKQLKSLDIPDPDVIYVTLGSAGTAAGIIAGALAAGLKSKIIPVRISFTAEYKSQRLCDCINAVGNFLKQQDPDFYLQGATLAGTQIIVPGLDVEIKHDFSGDDYAATTKLASEAILLLYTACGIKLEHTYTGKTLSALVDNAKKGSLADKFVLFWNTFSYGSFENLLSKISEEKVRGKLPAQMTHYLTDPMQPDDQGI